MCREVAVLELSYTGTGYSARSNVGVRSCYEPVLLIFGGELRVSGTLSKIQTSDL